VGVSSRYGAGGPVTNILPRPVTATASPERAMGAQERKRIEGGLIGDIDGRFIIDLNNQLLTVSDVSSVRRLEIGEVSSGVYGIKMFNQDAELTFSMINGVNAGVFLLRAGIGDDVGAGATGVALKVGTQFIINGTRQVAMEGGFTAAANNEQNFVGFRTDMSFDKNAKTGLKAWQIFLTNFTISGTGTMDQNTALEIADVTGATTNYAIKTGTGLVSFGGALTVTSINEAAVTDHEAAINHNALLNFASGEHFLQSAIVATGALDAGSITSGFGNINIGSSTLDCGALTATTGTFNTSGGTFFVEAFGGSSTKIRSSAAFKIETTGGNDITLAPNQVVAVTIANGGGVTLADDLTVSGATTVEALEINGALNHDGSTIGFFTTAPVVKGAAITGSRTDGTALNQLLGRLDGYGLITDSSTA